MKVLIAASGTGGHLFPALYIASALRGLSPNTDILFVGSGRPLEEKILGPSGLQRRVLKVHGLKSRGITGLLQFLVNFPSALFETWKLITEFKPDVVVGVGGYVTFFPILIAWLRQIPSWIHEAELSPGLANKVLSFFANTISVSFGNSKMNFPEKVIFTGHPVREGLAEIRNFEGVESIKHLLIMGGSQGAEAIDRAIVELSALLEERGIEVIHQCRAANVEKLKESYSKTKLKVDVVPFIEDMPKAYRWADIVISRSGAGSVMEIGVVNIPCIFVPFPFAQGNHQLANAQTLADIGKAIIVEEGPSFEPRLKQALIALLDVTRYNQMKAERVNSRNIDAAKTIALGILDLAQNKAI